MRVKTLVSAAMIVSALACGGCGKSIGLTPAGPVPDITGQNLVSLAPAEASNKFAADLYNRWKGEEGNVFFSPFSISSALAMTYEGARGTTADEMQRVFYFLTDPATRWNAYRSLFDVINDPVKNYKLSTSNNLWLQQSYPFKQDYIDIATQYYGAVPTNMDFIGDPEGSRLFINQTVSDQTENKINNLLPGGSIDTQTRLVLTNAIYFKADWADPFTVEDTTYQTPFYVTPGNSVPVTMMHQRIVGKVEDYNGVAQALEMPYVDREVSMFVFLPPEGGMAALETGLLGGALDAWMQEREGTPLGGGEVELSLPKFKFETQYDMAGTLSAMGMPTAFMPGAADLTGMADADLYITKVVHKAFVAVDEKGTEAAAATGVIIGFTSVPPPATPFNVNRPFIFMIRENSTGAILFMGRVNDPTA